MGVRAGGERFQAGGREGTHAVEVRLLQDSLEGLLGLLEPAAGGWPMRGNGEVAGREVTKWMGGRANSRAEAKWAALTSGAWEIGLLVEPGRVAPFDRWGPILFTVPDAMLNALLRFWLELSLFPFPFPFPSLSLSQLARCCLDALSDLSIRARSPRLPQQFSM